jgi:hypothetical protein
MELEPSFDFGLKTSGALLPPNRELRAGWADPVAVPKIEDALVADAASDFEASVGLPASEAAVGAAFEKLMGVVAGLKVKSPGAFAGVSLALLAVTVTSAAVASLLSKPGVARRGWPFVPIWTLPNKPPFGAESAGLLKAPAKGFDPAAGLLAGNSDDAPLYAGGVLVPVLATALGS